MYAQPSNYMQSGNPVLKGHIFDDWAYADRRGHVMTVEGTALKSLGLLVIVMACAAVAWTQMGRGTLNVGMLAGAAIGGLVLALVTVFKPSWAPITAPIYAACEGVALGALSNLINVRFPGLPIQAVALTFGTMFLMLFFYVTRMIRVTDKMVMGIAAATGGLMLVYLVSWLLRMFTGQPIPYIHGAGPIGIGFSLIVVALAAFNLLLDFDVIERGARAEAPKWMEWYGAFGLMVTLIWLYVEILHLLMKLQGRRDND